MNISQLFKKQDEFFDIPAQDLSSRQAREKLAQLASEVLSPVGVKTFKDLLALKGTPNGGNAITDDLKYTSKFAYGKRHIFSAASVSKISHGLLLCRILKC